MLATDSAPRAIELERDCDAILIPEGTPVRLPAGTHVYVTQALGGTVTVNVNGNLARVGAQDLDALGMETEQPAAAPAGAGSEPGGQVDEALVWDMMRTCYDPEIPINIVDLGLIYRCEVTPHPERPGSRVDVVMTLTAPGCGMGEILVDDVRGKIERLPNVAEVQVELSFDPPWNQEMMSEAARLQVGMY